MELAFGVGATRLTSRVVPGRRDAKRDKYAAVSTPCSAVAHCKAYTCRWEDGWFDKFPDDPRYKAFLKKRNLPE